ncbi:hypothetical protein M501DRAFT_990007 [Patellaria atrata CBS 101060]|uniref:Uncharacterized protein n=1 Tax=Patellaria atrata CBS 101060 TaxID=1346257 RepID=A0A9P4VVB9_9PEZI|nr:hypothetical protein M501DRAFT_990007 [Patellaria atrata CBS 101060]
MSMTSSSEVSLNKHLSSTYTHSGIGGAGNYHKKASLPPSPVLPTPLPVRTATHFTTGIGGAGNVHLMSKRATDDMADRTLAKALEKAIQERKNGAWHSGIGGAGNRVSAERLNSDGGSKSEVLPYGVLDRLSKKLSADKDSTKSGESFLKRMFRF